MTTGEELVFSTDIAHSVGDENRPRLHEVVDGLPVLLEVETKVPKEQQKTTIMTKRPDRDGMRKTENFEYTFVQNSYVTEDMQTVAKASSIGSTDKRS